jgi:formate hydrogenlyase subunit 3/multisubunit Na+/H+ antiporter MnhD subunit
LNAPAIWIFIPALAAVLLLGVRNQQKLTIWLGTGLMLFLSAAAWLIPIGKAISFGPLSFKIEETFTILGRKLTLDAGDRIFLVMIFMIGAFWFFGSLVIKSQPYLVPIGILILSLLVAAMAVQPFLYAAMLIELAVLVSIPLLVPPGGEVKTGITRYLIFQTLGMPFLLMTGWILSGFEAGPTDSAQIIRAEIMLGLGFAFLLAIFPFYTWIPLMAEQAHPYVAGFILLVFPTISLLFSLTFFDKYAWLKGSVTVFTALRIVGGLMIVTGGIWAAFQRHLGRMLGYGVIMETGYSLVAISLNNQTGYELFSAMFLPRALNLGLGFLALSLILKEASSLDILECDGLARKKPLLAAGYLVSIFSIAGFPLLAAFPSRFNLLEALAVQAQGTEWWILIGIVGYFLGCLNQLAVMVRGSEPFQLRSLSGRMPNFLVVGGILAQFVIGLLPQAFFTQLIHLIDAFKNLLV